MLAFFFSFTEKKLKRINGKHKPEPSSRDIISSLACFRDDQMHRFMDMEQCFTTAANSLTNQQSTCSLGSASYIQRRLHPERQAIDMEELFELLQDDELARSRGEDDEEGSLLSVARNYNDSEIQRKQNDSTEEHQKAPQENYVEVSESSEETVTTSAAVRETDTNEVQR